jgi:hypothetical protein
MQKIINFKTPPKINNVPADKRILVFRRGVRYYQYPRKGKALQVCS